MNLASIVAHDVTELAEKMSALEFKPTLAICFAAVGLLNESLTDHFKQNNITVLGAQSYEEISDDQLYQNTIAVMLFDITPEAFSLKHFEGKSQDIGASMVAWAAQSYSNPVLLTLVGGGGFSINGDELLLGITSENASFPIYGGLASSHFGEALPSVFDQDGILQDSAIALAINNDVVDFQGIAISGWAEVGTAKEITRAEGNHVFEIEGINAIDFYQKYFKIDLDNPNTALEHALEYPLKFINDDGAEIVRVAIGIDKEQEAIVFGGSIPAGARVRFCSPNIVETIQHTAEQIQHFSDGLSDARVDGVLLFDCAVRSRSFGPYMKKELEVIKQLWNVPIAGFSSWGEIGNAPGRSCGYHNTVISFVLIRDKTATYQKNETSLSNEAVEELVESIDEDNKEVLKRQLATMRRQKNMLSNFLHLTSDDLDSTLLDVQREKKKADNLLLNILPTPIAGRLKQGETTIADNFESVTVLFSDLVGFTKLSSTMPSFKLVKLLNSLFSNFDELAIRYGAEKIKTIGDAYMAVAGLPEKREDHADVILKLAKGMLKVMQLFNEKHGTQLAIRVGINSGPVIAGVIGKRKFIYDLWGDAVNIASRMESHGIPGQIQISEDTYGLLSQKTLFSSRGAQEIKGKGQMNTYITDF